MFGTAQARKYIFHSIVGWKDGTPVKSGTTCNTAVNTGSNYQDLSVLTGGIVDSVCKTDYSGVLDKLATGIVNRLSCELSVPTAAAADPTTLVVQYTSAVGAVPEALIQVTDSSKCASVANAWYYDDNAAPKKIILCPTTCTRSSSTAGSKVDALVGCKAPPPR